MQKIRKHRLCENGIENCRPQLTTFGAGGGFKFGWCPQHHGFQALSERSRFRINNDGYSIRKFSEIHMNYF